MKRKLFFFAHQSLRAPSSHITFDTLNRRHSRILNFLDCASRQNARAQNTSHVMLDIITNTNESHKEEELKRIQWANSLRKVVTRKDAIDAETGALKQQFFKPTKIVFETSGKKWGDDQRQKLYEGLHTFGVGEWMKMKEHFHNELGEWTTLDLRVKASRMLGTQSLSRYPKGWKGTKAEVDLEYEKHKEIGEKTGCWKSGTLVEDDDGSVAKLLKEREMEGK